MIAIIEGTVSYIDDDGIVVLVGGIGFRVNVTVEVLKKVELHKFVSLHTYLIVREDALILFGFETMEERTMFALLLGASGVGPRTALGIISSLSLNMITEAVIKEQPEIFTRVSGIGKKTAQSIILHLQGKVQKSDISPTTSIREVDADVIAALTGLGYSIVEAQAAIQMIPKDAGEDLETRVRLALQYFS